LERLGVRFRFMQMRRLLVLMLSAGLFVVQSARAQDATTTEASATGVVLTKLSPPVYPRAARMAHIAGDVRIDLVIRRDGSVESAVLFSGQAMLFPAALQSAKQSLYECRGCDGATSYSLTYTFAIGTECHNSPDCSALEDRSPDIQQSLNHVAITVDPLCTCDPASIVTRIKWRSAKCLYLWHCASRVIDRR
jgi:hypothetical protein